MNSIIWDENGDVQKWSEAFQDFVPCSGTIFMARGSTNIGRFGTTKYEWPKWQSFQMDFESSPSPKLQYLTSGTAKKLAEFINADLAARGSTRKVVATCPPTRAGEYYSNPPVWTIHVEGQEDNRDKCNAGGLCIAFLHYGTDTPEVGVLAELRKAGYQV